MEAPAKAPFRNRHENRCDMQARFRNEIAFSAFAIINITRHHQNYFRFDGRWQKSSIQSFFLSFSFFSIRSKLYT